MPEFLEKITKTHELCNKDDLLFHPCEDEMNSLYIKNKIGENIHGKKTDSSKLKNFTKAGSK